MKGIADPSDTQIRFKDESCWRRRSPLEASLISLTLFLIGAVGGLIVLVVLLNGKTTIITDQKTPDQPDQKTPDDPVCLAEACVVAAGKVAEALDRSVDPCNDFYEFACGTWVKKREIPESATVVGQFNILDDEVKVIVKNLLQRDDAEIEAVQKAKLYYQACMDTDLIEERNVTMLYDLIEEIGGWPVLNQDWNPSSFDFMQQLLKLDMIDSHAIVEAWVGSDDKNSTVSVLKIDQPSVGMPSMEYMLKGRNDTMVEAYVDLAKNIAVELGADVETAASDMSDIVDFEIALANISTPREERRNETALYNRMTLEELAQEFPEFDWKTYIRKLIEQHGLNFTIGDSEPVVIRSPDYYRKLHGILTSTNNRTIANYMIWRPIKDSVFLLPKRFRDLLQDYGSIVYGTTSSSPRWKTCVFGTTNSLGLAVGRMFVEKYFDKEAKSSMLDMITNLRTSMKDLISQLDWMDKETKPIAQEKADAISPKIGYPSNPDILDDNILNDYYKMYNYAADTYFENAVSDRKQYAYRRYYDLRMPVDRTKWESPPTQVNAFYSPTKNMIMFPAGILQPPFYKKDQPLSMNYGGIGVVIGHEITHGFDDSGSQYDKDGNVETWWSSYAVEQFGQRKQCIVDQYGKFYDDQANMTLNGINTQGENIADNGGLRQSFRAYRQLIKTRGQEEPALPGLGFTSNQLFFVNFAQIWCNNMRKERAINYILNGVHSKPRFRVIGSLQNSPDFAEAFKCPAGSFMNPGDKCSVW